jgi:uncharacterized protein (DUF1800 family)
MLRRSFLASAAAVSAATVPRLVAAMPAPQSPRPALHILNRLALGPSAADLQRIEAVGIVRYIEEQLNPQDIAEPPELTARLAALTTLALDPVELWREYGPLLPVDGEKPDPDAQKAQRQRARIIVEEASAARVWRALASPRQLHEVMVDFWYNHFNVFAEKGLDHLWVGAYEREAIRPHALGRFRDLLGATAHHPAMLFYLDNFQNVAPGTPGPKGQTLGINENYARELMELHTLGVDGGYTQADVIALARILTGWSLMRPRFLPAQGGGFAFYPRRHDDGIKHFLGRDIAPAGEAEGEAALDILAKSPATAHHIALQLAQYFVADAPPASIVERLAQRFQTSDGDLREMLATLFASPEFRGSAGAKYKSPYRYVLSAARAAGVPVNNPRPLLGTMLRLGQPLYHCLTPDGWKDTEAAWLSPDATMLRVSFATALAAGRLPLGAAPPREADPPVVMAAAHQEAEIDAGALERLLGPTLSGRTRAVAASAAPELRAALLLGSPDFMRQ